MINEVSKSSGAFAVELASKAHRNVFVGYMVWLVVASLVTLFFTWALWKYSNRQQDAVKAEANERTLKLERDATDSKAAQQRVETELAEARTKQAEAERSLLELQQLLKEPRTIDIERAKKILGSGSKGSVTIFRVPNNQDAENLAKQIEALLTEYGWKVGSILEAIAGGYSQPGIKLEIGVMGANTDGTPESLPEPANTLYRFLHESVKLNPSVLVEAYPNVSQDKLQISVGPKY
jgi:hypothetical protein